MITKIGLALFGLYVLAQLPFNTPQKAPSRGGGGTLEFQRSKEPSVAQGQEKPLPVRGKPYDKYQQEIDQAWLNQHRGIKAGCNRFNPTYPNGKPVSESDRQRFNQLQKRGQDDLAYRQSIGDREEAAAGLKEVEKLRAEGVPLGLHQPGKAKATSSVGRGRGGDTGRLAKFGHSEPSTETFRTAGGGTTPLKYDPASGTMVDADTELHDLIVDGSVVTGETFKPQKSIPTGKPATQQDYEQAVAKVRAGAIKQEQRIREMTDRILAGKEPMAR